MPFEFPREPLGRRADVDIQRLWEDLWKLVEELRLLEERINRELRHD